MAKTKAKRSRLRAPKAPTLAEAIQGAAVHAVATGHRSETRWRGASQTLRSMAGWVTNVGSGRTDMHKSERDRMTARSYDAYRNHMIARSATTRARTNIVGGGLIMHPTVDHEVLGISEEESDVLNAQIGREWESYYESPEEVDLEGQLDGYGLQALAFVTSWLAGDCFALTPFIDLPNTRWSTRLQLVDPARVSNPNGTQDTATLLDGVELSAIGRPTAIHIADRHPDDRVPFGSQHWERRDIYSESGQRRIFQVWNDKDRIGTTRGAPALAPILEPLQTLEIYSRAELMAAVVSAMFTVFIKKPAEVFDAKGNPIPVIAGARPDTKYGTDTPAATNTLQMGNAAIVDLAPGEEAQMADPARPSAKYDPFFLAVVRQIGATLEIPLDELLLHYQDSYSAARAAMLQAWRFYVMRRWWLVQQFCQPHYRLWFDEAVARGRITVSNYADPARRAAYQQATWIGPARGAMDEGQEAAAAKTRVEGGFSNEAIEIAAMMGQDRRTVYRQRKREIEQRKKDGTLLGPAPGQASVPGGEPPAPGEPRRPSALPPDDEDEDEPDEGEE